MRRGAVPVSPASGAKLPSLADVARPLTKALQRLRTLARMKTALRVALVSLALTGALVRAGAAPAATPCWKSLLNEWYSGRIQHIYPLHCYQDALKHLPADVSTYSSARCASGRLPCAR